MIALIQVLSYIQESQRIPPYETYNDYDGRAGDYYVDYLWSLKEYGYDGPYASYVSYAGFEGRTKALRYIEQSVDYYIADIAEMYVKAITEMKEMVKEMSDRLLGKGHIGHFTEDAIRDDMDMTVSYKLLID